MHVIIQMIIPMFGCVKEVRYEAIYVTALTTSQVGWKKGVEYAIRKRGNGKKFIINWIEGLRDNEGHIGAGKLLLSMNSRRVKQWKLWKIDVSMYNLMRACEQSDHLRPKEIINNMTKTSYHERRVNMGLENVGMFQAQQLVQIVTLVNLMKRKDVCDHVGVADGTETYTCMMAMDSNFKHG